MEAPEALAAALQRRQRCGGGSRHGPPRQSAGRASRGGAAGRGGLEPSVPGALLLHSPLLFLSCSLIACSLSVCCAGATPTPALRPAHALPRSYTCCARTHAVPQLVYHSWCTTVGERSTGRRPGWPIIRRPWQAGPRPGPSSCRHKTPAARELQAACPCQHARQDAPREALRPLHLSSPPKASVA